MLRSICLTSLSLLLIASACGSDKSTSADTSAAPTTAGVSVDSALPREVELERFRQDLGPEVTELDSDLRSRAELVTEYLKNLEAGNADGISRLGLTKSEFAWLYYPSNPMGKPPYDLSPGLMYFQFDGNSRKGLSHALEERGGRKLNVVGFSCATEEKQGENTVFSQCLFKRVQAPGDTVSELLFGGIVERHGRFKIINFANKF